MLQLQFQQNAPASAKLPILALQTQPTEADILTNLNDQTLDSLSLISHPSAEFRLAAIRKTIFAMQYFENPTQEEWLTAIDLNPEAPYFLEGLWSNAPVGAKVAAVIANPSIINQVIADETLELIAWLATYLRAGLGANQLYVGPCWHTSTLGHFLPLLNNPEVTSQVILYKTMGQTPHEIARSLIESGKDALPATLRGLMGSVIPASP